MVNVKIFSTILLKTKNIYNQNNYLFIVKSVLDGRPFNFFILNVCYVILLFNYLVLYAYFPVLYNNYSYFSK